MFNIFNKKDFHKINPKCIGVHPIIAKRGPTDQDNKGMIPGISFWIKDDRSAFWFYNLESKWIELNIHQPERSKREDVRNDGAVL